MSTADIEQQIFTLLTREASLAAMSMGVGLTHIGQYNYAQTGFFHSGMFSLCVGLERVMKIILIYDHRLTHDGAFPDNEALKSHGHRISTLLQKAKEIAERHELEVDDSEINDSIQAPIVQFLTDFATNARYYNLDTLTGRSHQSLEPLARWNSEVCSTIVQRHYKPSERRQAKIALVGEPLGSFAHIQQTSDSGVQLTDAASAVSESALIDTKQRYSRLYLLALVKYVCNVLRELEYKGNFYPCLREFFPVFTGGNRKDDLKKKSWNPFPPYHF